MNKQRAKRVSVKKYPGVSYRDTTRGRVFDISYRVSGRLVWEKVGFEHEGYSAKLASTIRGKRIQAIRHGEDLPRDRSEVPTFGEVATEFLEWAESNKKSWKDDRARYLTYLEPRFSRLSIDSIRPLDLERLKADLKKAGKAPGTVRQVLALFRAIFNRGRSWFPVMTNLENPMRSVAIPRVDNARERFLSVEEVQLLLDELRPISPQAYGMALMAYHTGARLSELRNLRWADVNLDARYVTFRDAKNGSSEQVPLGSTLRSFLRELGPKKPTDPVFCTGDGRQVRHITKTYQRTVDRLFNRGLPQGDRRQRVVFHTLRHTFASHLVASGHPLSVVQELLRHKSLSMVQRYTHVAPGAKREAVESLGGVRTGSAAVISFPHK